MENTLENLELIREKVSKYVDDYGLSYITDYEKMSTGERSHIKDIATSIMNTKLEVGYPAGSFVTAVVDNSLSGAIAYADSINLKALRFYTIMLYNLSIY